MNTPHVLVTGDYGHRDFVDLVLHARFPITLCPLACLGQQERSDTGLALVVIAQSRRGQFANIAVEEIVDRYPGIPVICLCGSWCEGELRSGQPVCGVLRVYWHQWQGRLESFLEQLQRVGVTAWHLPRICSEADRIISEIRPNASINHEVSLGISSPTLGEYQMLQDACRQFSANAVWIAGGALPEKNVPRLDALLAVANSWDDQLVSRIVALRKTFATVPIAAIVNFPRQRDVAGARRVGVAELISKPFELKDVHHSLKRMLAAA